MAQETKRYNIQRKLKYKLKNTKTKVLQKGTTELLAARKKMFFILFFNIINDRNTKGTYKRGSIVITQLDNHCTIASYK